MVWEAEARGVPISRQETNYNYNIIQMIFVLSYYNHTFYIHPAYEEEYEKWTIPKAKL